MPASPRIRMTALIEIVTNWPDPALNPNNKDGKHWGAYNRAKVAARGAAKMLSLRWRDVFPPDVALVCVITLEPPDNRRRDTDNVFSALKPTLDGIAAGCNFDDSRIWTHTIKRREPHPPAGRVTISLHLDLEY